MLKKSIDMRKSLTARIFLMTVLLILASSSATYLFIAWATPISYRSITTNDLSEQLEKLADSLNSLTLEESGPVLERFTRDTGAEVLLTDESGNEVGSEVRTETEAYYEGIKSAPGTSAPGTNDLLSSELSLDVPSIVSAADSAAADSAAVNRTAAAERAAADTISAVDSVMITSSDWDFPVKFRGSGETYYLSVLYSMKTVNQTVEAMGRVLPYLAVVMGILSLFGALFYSRSITRPIVQLSKISKKMAALDFTSKCQETRRDEIGMLGQSLNELSEHLSSALDELREANMSLQQDLERERLMEQQRSAFFAAASHELKTPITILKGQISGMLAGVDIYQDRDKYLARSLAVTGRMEKLIREILTISRMEKDDAPFPQEPVNLSELVEEQISIASDLALLKEQRLEVCIAPDILVPGDGPLLSLAVSGLLSNALNYSPEKAVAAVRLEVLEAGPVLTIKNSGVRIPEESLPHLFEPFYRVESSRSRETGGSGLGLYLVRMILDRHHAECSITNTEDGVLAAVAFPKGAYHGDSC